MFLSTGESENYRREKSYIFVNVKVKSCMRTAFFWAIILEDRTDRFSRNFGKELPLHAA
jgi:hypothetical protein